MGLSTYTLEELLRQWMNEELTADQAIGHLLQHLLLQQQQVLQIERAVAVAAAGIPVNPGADAGGATGQSARRLASNAARARVSLPQAAGPAGGRAATGLRTCVATGEEGGLCLSSVRQSVGNASL